MPIPTFKVKLATIAEFDMLNTYNYIAFQLMQPDTAMKYLDGIQSTIHSLGRLAYIFAISQSDDIQRQYGPEARTVIYKKMTIIYNIFNKTVLVRRVIPSGLII